MPSPWQTNFWTPSKVKLPRVLKISSMAPNGDRMSSLLAHRGVLRFLGQVDLFAPIMQDQTSLLYANLRGTFTDDPIEEGNFGLGYRQIVPGGFFGQDAIYGIYGFFDVRSSTFNNTFYQGTIGAELITENLEFRINGYLPDNNVHAIGGGGGNAVALAGNNVVFAGGLAEQALPGFDVEAGIKIDFSDAALRFNAGYFRFERDNILAEGPRARVELEFEEPFGWDGATLSVGGEIRNDQIRGTESYGIVRLRLPLDGGSGASENKPQLSALEKLMTRRVFRDDDIITPAVETGAGGGNAGTPVEDAISGETLQVFFVANSAQGAGDCSDVTNACTFATAQGLAGAGDTFLSVDVAGPIGAVFNLNADRQQVAGAGDNGEADITLSDAGSNVLNVGGLGGRPTIGGANLGAVADPTVFGVTTNTATGITGNGFTGTATVSDVQSTNGGLNFMNSGATINVTGSTFDAGGNTGVALNNLTGPFTMNGGSVAVAAGTGIDIDGGAGGTFTFAGVDIDKTGAGGHVVDINGAGGSVSFDAATTIDDTAGGGILLNGADRNVDFLGQVNLSGASRRRYQWWFGHFHLCQHRHYKPCRGWSRHRCQHGECHLRCRQLDYPGQQRSGNRYCRSRHRHNSI